MVLMFSKNPVVVDICATTLSGGIALSTLKLWEETAKRGLLDQKLNRKLVHVSVGLVFMLCWPLFSSGHQGVVLAEVFQLFTVYGREEEADTLIEQTTRDEGELELRIFDLY